MKKTKHKSGDLKRDPAWEDKYASYVEHPRYGRKPRFTSLNESTHPLYGWHSLDDDMIRGTAVAADPTHQFNATFWPRHYFDRERVCRDCKRPFLFFAAEQKYWYEDLEFGLDSDCVRCIPCRKKEQGIARKRERYEELFHVADRSVPQTLEMAECCLSSIEAKIFHTRQTERVRMLLNQIPEEHRPAVEFQSLVLRLKEAEELKSPVEPTNT